MIFLPFRKHCCFKVLSLITLGAYSSFFLGQTLLFLLPMHVFADEIPNGCGKYSSQASNNQGYTEGFYSGWLTRTDITELNFCAVSYLYPSSGEQTAERRRAHIVNGRWQWNCKSISTSNPDIDTCTAPLLPLEKSECLSNDIAYDKKPAPTALTPLCKKADPHGFVDPGYPTVSAISGGNDKPWTWTCGGTYYEPITCSAPSKGKCMDTVNKTYDELLPSDALCENGKYTNFTFNTGTYKRTWTCKGSEPQYDVACSAQKTTEKGECSFIFNNRSFDTLDTGQALCSKGVIKDFTFVNSNVDAAYGWTWTCEGSIPSLNDYCRASKIIVKGMCNTAVTTKEWENLTLEDELCAQGTATGLLFNQTTLKRTWTCAGSRQKDNVTCSANMKKIQGSCGPKNGQSCETLIPEDTASLCAGGTVSGFVFNATLGKRQWYCIGNPPSLSVQCTATKSIAGVCGTGLVGKVLTYEQARLLPLCNQGTPDISELPQYTTGGFWNWTCQGVGGGSGVSCTSRQLLTGQCANILGPVTILPAQLCTAGIPVQTKIVGDRRVWTCQGFNGGASVQCSAPCVDGKCIKDGDYGPCDANGMCTQGVCRNGRCVNDTDVSDGIPSTVYQGQTCNDVDGCMCGTNRIFNGTVCQGGYNPNDPEDIKNPEYRMPIFRPQLEDWGSLYDASMMLPGDADVVVDHTTTTGKVYRRQEVGFTITYRNDGPDPAYGVYIAYKYSELLSDDIRASVPMTRVTIARTGNTTTQQPTNTQTVNNVTTTVTRTGVVVDLQSVLPHIPPSLLRTDMFSTGYVLTGQTGLRDSTVALSGTHLFTGVMLSGYVHHCTCSNRSCYCIPVMDQTSSVSTGGMINANTTARTTGTAATVVGGTNIYDRVVFFYIGTLQPGQTGRIVVTGTLLPTLSGRAVTNIAQIQSRVKDPNKLNNTKSASAVIEDIYYTNFSLINPLLALKPTLDKWRGIVGFVDAKTDFRDVISGHPWYMHIMTVQRNGIMKGYEYQYSTLFAPKRCISRLEYLLVMARIMNLTSEFGAEVAASPFTKSPYVDVKTTAVNVKYLNWAHKRGLVDVFKAGKSNPELLGPDKPVKPAEAKEIIYRLYRLMQADTRVLTPLFVGSGFSGSGKCITREETAYAIAHILRGNPNVVMGFNDIFLSKLYEFLMPMSVAQRRDIISRLIFKIKSMSPAMLYKLGLDGETLNGVLSAAMKGEEYKLPYTTTTVQDFFYEIARDEYDRYIESLYR